MNKLFKIEAEIEFNIESERTWPIKNGYRPGFKFEDKMQTSGAIHMIDREELKAGEKGIVQVWFVHDTLLGDVHSGVPFEFYEGHAKIGQGHVLKVLGWVER